MTGRLTRFAAIATCTAAALLAVPATALAAGNTATTTAAPAAPGDIRWFYAGHYPPSQANRCSYDGFFIVAQGRAATSTCTSSSDGGADLWLGYRQD